MRRPRLASSLEGAYRSGPRYNQPSFKTDGVLRPCIGDRFAAVGLDDLRNDDEILQLVERQKTWITICCSGAAGRADSEINIIRCGPVNGVVWPIVPMGIGFDAIWKIVSAPFSVRESSLHGPEHWRRVERNGLLLSSQTGANINVVRLFALFHDSRRLNDGWDPGHGARGAEFAATLHGKSFQLADDEFKLFQYACIWHTEGGRHENVTVATCWDADRLDLGRVGIVPDPNRMCTDFGRQVAAAGSVERFLESASAGLSFSPPSK